MKKCDLCPYKITVKWAELLPKDREYILSFMNFLLEKQGDNKKIQPMPKKRQG